MFRSQTYAFEIRPATFEDTLSKITLFLIAAGVGAFLTRSVRSEPKEKPQLLWWA
jgi:hypothetical protein